MSAACETQRRHACCNAGSHTCRAILNDETFCRVGTHLFGSMQEEIRGGLAPGDLHRAEDVRREELMKFCDDQSCFQFCRDDA